ncbi:LysR family transcriptional regulator [Ideonella sp.]|uniref:LysR family transcriptional regulator n=1 Tax=Ideonella sp. TaxID=1929293 RepID=UPI0035AFA589
MAKLDIDWLRVFLAIHHSGSVTRAAEQLGLSQATASIMLGKLRRHFADPLFVRSAHGMVPTPHALSLHAGIAAAVQQLDTLAGTAARRFDPLTAERAFRVAMTDISEIVILPALVNRLQRLAPGVRIEAERIAADSARRLESGELDLAVGFMPQLEAGFYQQTLFEQDFVCLAARSHPRVQGRLTRRGFLAEGHLVVTTSGTGHAIVDKVLARQGWPRRVVLQVPGFLGVARLVATTELLVVVPRRLGEALARQERVQVLAPPLALPPFAVKQHWHERVHADVANGWLRRTLAAAMAASPPRGPQGGD